MERTLIRSEILHAFFQKCHFRNLALFGSVVRDGSGRKATLMFFLNLKKGIRQV